jgi:hypothetical protein
MANEPLRIAAFALIGVAALKLMTETASASEVYGCTDPNALNYNPNATIDDESCVYQPVNTPPVKPVNYSPPSGATGVSLTPTLSALSFSDLDAGDSHLASQWQITMARGNYSNPVFDSGTDMAHLQAITIPDGVLDYLTTYYWRVRYRDEHGAWSSYSTEWSFTTINDDEPPPVTYGATITVLNDLGTAPLSGAAVTIEGVTVYTNSLGEASFDFDTAGSYDLDIIYTGYNPFSGSFTISP